MKKKRKRKYIYRYKMYIYIYIKKIKTVKKLNFEKNLKNQKICQKKLFFSKNLNIKKKKNLVAQLILFFMFYSILLYWDNTGLDCVQL